MIIVIEGPDKVGKATQSKMLTESLNRNGWTATRVEVPVKGLTHKAIYWMLDKGWARRLPNLFQFVQFLNKLAFQLLELPSLEDEYDYVVLDRWKLSAVVYGDASGTNPRFNRLLCSLLREAESTLVIYGPSFKRGDDDSYEADAKLQQDVRDGYRRWVGDHPSNHELVSNDGPIDEVHQRLLCVLVHAGVLPDFWISRGTTT